MTRVVIVGAGQAGFQAAVSLRKAGYQQPVTLIGDEPGLPYQRPPLSKELLAGAMGADQLPFRPVSFYDHQGIELRMGDRVQAVDRAHCAVRLASGASLRYDHLVLATGARPRRLRVPGAQLDGVVVLRTTADAHDLRRRLLAARRAVVVGGGFIGLEVVAAAANLGVEVTVLEALPRLMSRAVSPPISEHCARHHQRSGVRIERSSGIAAMVGDAAGRVRPVAVSDGRELPADVVLLGVGVEPVVDLAEACGLATDDGILVDEHLRTADARISAVGDCASFPSPLTGAALRLESVQNAADQARCVARRLATGEAASYESVPWFWSTQGDLKLQMVGVTAGHDQTIVRGDPETGRFSVFCFRRRRLFGVESINAPADHIAARKLLGGARHRIAALSPDRAADVEFDLKAYAKGQVVSS